MNEELEELLSTTVRDICKVPNDTAKSLARKKILEFAVAFAEQQEIKEI